jgi:flagellar protein FlgJ
MELSALTGAYSDYYSQLKSSAETSENVSKLSSAAQNAATDDELMDVCKQFEAYLVEQLMKSMESTAHVFSDEEKDASTENLVDYFKDQTIQALASDTTERQGLGIAQMLYENMKVNMGLTLDQISETAAESGAVSTDTEE